MKILGVDPGVSGALAFLDTQTQDIRLWDMPTWNEELKKKKKNGQPKIRRHIDCKKLHEIVWQIFLHDCQYVIIEKVHSMGTDGAVQAFSFGESYGAIQGVLGAFSFEGCFVTPQVWKKHQGLSGCDKKASIARCKEYYPNAELTKATHHGRADALLIAGYLHDIKKEPVKAL